MNLELPEYVLLALVIALGVAGRHWWQRHQRTRQETPTDPQD